MVTSNDKWFNEMDGEPAVPSSRKMHGSGARGNSSAGPAREDYVMTRSTAFHESGHSYQDVVLRRFAKRRHDDEVLDRPRVTRNTAQPY